MAAALFLVFAYLVSRGAGTREHRPLFVLEAFAALLTWLVAVQPTFVKELSSSEPGQVIALVDTSRSMQVARGSTPRVEIAARAVEGLPDEVTVFSFGDEVAAVPDDEPLSATAERSDLGRALEEVALTEDLGAVVVISDGALTDLPIDPRVRVHAFAVDPDGELMDDSVVEVAADAMVFQRQVAKARVTVRSLGRGAQVIPVTLSREGEVVSETVVTLNEEGVGSVNLEFVERQLGRAVYHVSIPTPDGDAVPKNNSRAFLVDVVRDRLRVLLVAGHPTWDVRFLRELIKKDGSIDLISFFILRTNADLSMANPDELALIPFPTDELFREHLGSFDVIVFQDFDFGPYQMEGYLPRIRDYVRRGGSFAMIGGERSFSVGGYAETPIAEVLPVTLPPTTAGTRSLDLSRFSPVMQDEVARHPIVGLAAAPDESAALFRGLPELIGSNRFRGVKAGASVLLSRPRGGAPILVVGESGQGRVLAFASDGSWRWGVTAGGQSGDASVHERFWDRVLRWLARDPRLEPARLSTDRASYGASAIMRVRGVLRDASYVPRDGSVALSIVALDAAEVEGEAEAESAQVVRVISGEIEAELTAPEVAGAYRVVAREVGNEGAVLAEEAFVVETSGRELADPVARPDVLRELAERSGGSFHDANNPPALSQLDTQRVRHDGVQRIAPMAHPLTIVATILLLGAVFWLRRRRGLR